MSPRAFSARAQWLSIKYILLPTLVGYFAVCFLFDMPLLSSKLPRYSGPYDVGTIDVEAPCDKRTLFSTILKETGKAAFELDTVLFTLYYPSVKGVKSKRARHPWVPKPVSLHGEGYARFIHANNWFTNHVFTFALWALAGSTKVPASVDVPLHGTVSAHDSGIEQPMENTDQFPVIVFSHGMASMRTGYTHYCGELASRGYIVAILEHRDGSGPGTIIMRDKEARPFYHIHPGLLEPEPSHEEFKKMQLATRETEVEEVVRVLRDINNGRGEQVYKSSPRMEGHDLAQWKGRMNLQQLVIGGHSFGATLALQTLRGGPSESKPFIGAVILDPGKSSGPLNDDVRVPIVVVHSQSWSSKHTIFDGSPHFAVVKTLVQKIRSEQHKCAWFTTAKGSTIDAREGVGQSVQITDDFMQFLRSGVRSGVLNEDVTHPTYDEDIRTEDRKSHMDPAIEKFWQIHVAPPAP